MSTRRSSKLCSSTVLISTQLLFFLMGTKNLAPSACDSLLVLMQLAPLCLGKVLPRSPPLYSPAILQHTVYLFAFVEGYPRRCGKLDVWLGVATCVSCDAAGLVAAKAQRYWRWCSLAACTAAPGLTQFVQISPRCHLTYCWHLG